LNFNTGKEKNILTTKIDLLNSFKI
jgi:hypothetical protein